MEEKIVYKKATSLRKIFFSLVFMTYLILITEWRNNWLRLFCVLILAFQFLPLFIKYSFSIEEDKVIDKIFLFNHLIYQKQVDHSMIKKVVFRRINWSTKQAVIKLNKGLSIRVSLFTPDTVFNHLIAFCEKNKIPFEKTKDYKILER